MDLLALASGSTVRLAAHTQTTAPGSPGLPEWFAFGFLFIFIGMWLIVTTALDYFSGWYSLRRRFPNIDEQAVDRLHFRSGLLGKGSMYNPWGNVSYGNCLRFDVCPSGLRVAVWRIFGPFSGPFFVPWQDISVEQKNLFFLKFYRLSFGGSGESALTIGSWTYRRIAANCPPANHFSGSMTA